MVSYLNVANVESALSLIRKVPLALGAALLSELGDHDDCRGSLLQHHGPEVVHRVRKGPLRGYERRLVATVAVAAHVVGVDVGRQRVLLVSQTHSRVLIGQNAAVAVFGAAARQARPLRDVGRDLPKLRVQRAGVAQTPAQPAPGQPT